MMEQPTGGARTWRHAGGTMEIMPGAQDGDHGALKMEPYHITSDITACDVYPFLYLVYC